MFDLCRIARIVNERQEMIGCFHTLFSVFSSISPIVGIVLSLQGDYQSSRHIWLVCHTRQMVHNVRAHSSCSIQRVYHIYFRGDQTLDNGNIEEGLVYRHLLSLA